MLIFDFKTGSPNPCTELQVSAYVELVRNGIGGDGKKFMDRENKTAFEVRLYHPLYGYAGTVDMVIDDGKATFEGHALYLKENGKYKLETIPNVRRNLEVFLCKLTSYKWDKEKGLI